MSLKRMVKNGERLRKSRAAASPEQSASKAAMASHLIRKFPFLDRKIIEEMNTKVRRMLRTMLKSPVSDWDTPGFYRVFWVGLPRDSSLIYGSLADIAAFMDETCLWLLVANVSQAGDANTTLIGKEPYGVFHKIFNEDAEAVWLSKCALLLTDENTARAGHIPFSLFIPFASEGRTIFARCLACHSSDIATAASRWVAAICAVSPNTEYSLVKRIVDYELGCRFHYEEMRIIRFNIQQLLETR